MKKSGIIMTIATIAIGFSAYTIYSNNSSIEVTNNEISYSNIASELNEISPVAGSAIDEAITYSSDMIEDISANVISTSETAKDCIEENMNLECKKIMENIGK